MTFESDSKIHSVFIKNETLILDPEIQHDLNLKGYGEMKENKLILKPFESLYLLHIGKLVMFETFPSTKTSLLTCSFATL